MSSPDSKEATGWALWRKLMFAGGLVLFLNALATALMDPDPPRVVDISAQVIGFLLLAAGFGQRFRNPKR